jgi:hypothetical protein
MHIIEKQKKDLIWVGFPAASNSKTQLLENQKQQLRTEIQMKRETLRDLIKEVNHNLLSSHPKFFS